MALHGAASNWSSVTVAMASGSGPVGDSPGHLTRVVIVHARPTSRSSPIRRSESPFPPTTIYEENKGDIDCLAKPASVHVVDHMVESLDFNCC